MIPNDPYYRQQWHFQLIGDVGSIWEDYTGAGIHVGVYDTGIQNDHPDLQANYDASRHVKYRGVTYLGSPNDASTDITNPGHGTAVAGLIGATGNNGIGVVGVAWGSSLTGVNIFDTTTPLDNNSGNDGYLAALHQMTNFDVVNKSWNNGANYVSNAYQDSELGEYRHAAVDGRDGLGTIIVQSAGNANRDAGGSAYNSSRFTITVAATKQDGWATHYSNYGNTILVTAPGSEPKSIVTTDRTGDAGWNGTTFDSTGNYTLFDGTSASAPIVSGVVTLMLDANPNLGWRDVQEILSLTATFTGGPYIGYSFTHGGGEYDWGVVGQTRTWNGGGQHYNPLYGYGMVNAFDAVRMAEAYNYFMPAAKTASNEMRTSGTSYNISVNDGGRTFVNFNVPDNMLVEHVDVEVKFTHEYTQQLAFYLSSPDGKLSLLGDMSTYTGNALLTNYTYTFGLDNLRGTYGEGSWSVMVLDKTTGNVGTLHSVTFSAYGSPISADNVYHYTSEFSEMAALPQGEQPRNELVDFGGIDWIDASTITRGVQVDLTAGTGKIDEVDMTISGIENVMGGDYRDFLTGDSGSNTLVGMRGADWLDGRGGSDKMIGGRGDDTYVVDSVGDRVTEFSGEGRDVILTYISYALTRRQDIEQIAAQNGAGANALTLTGNAFDQTLSGHEGANDTLIGMGGNDRYIVNHQGISIEEQAGQGFDIVTTSVSYRLKAGVSIEVMNFANNVFLENVRLTGNAFDQQIGGNFNNDILDGGGGTDTLYGAYGDDTYYVDSRDDVVKENDGQGTDTVISEGSYKLAAGQSIENLSLGNVSAKTALNLTGNEFFQWLRGNAGDNVLDGGVGFDTMVGLGGNDTYRVDNLDDVVYETASGGRDTVLVTGSFVLIMGSEVEVLAAEDVNSKLGVYLEGNEYGQRITGNAGDNALFAASGNDRLVGGLGTDNLYGGTGTDIFAFNSVAEIGLATVDCDVIRDFSQAEGDHIDLSGIDANRKAKGDQAFRFIGTQDFQQKAGELIMAVEGQNTFVYGDVNGDGEADFKIFFTSALTLNRGDFIL